ncbi:hypothetical protein D9M72_531980 [compost metagenome]
MAEHAGQADHFQRSIGQVQAVALGQGFQVGGCGSLLDGHLPELAVTGAVQLARLSESSQLFGGSLDAAAFLTDQEKLAARQAGG